MTAGAADEKSEKEAPAAVVVMGVAGAGKSTVGARLAAALGAAFIEADRLHPQSSIEKMSAGIPLTDADREPWLRVVGHEIAMAAASGDAVVCACSSLRRAYRDLLRDSSGLPLTFIYLDGSRALISERMALRTGHFFSPSLIDSQFATLEPPDEGEGAIAVDLRQPLEEVVADALRRLDERQTPRRGAG